MSDTNARPLDVLWTSGWDSTYIVLEATLLRARAVHPHYVSTPGPRGSRRAPMSRRSGDPCGICPPCHDARHQDMGWRLTPGARWRGRVIDAAPGGLLKRVVRKAIPTLVP